LTATVGKLIDVMESLMNCLLILTHFPTMEQNRSSISTWIWGVSGFLQIKTLRLKVEGGIDGLLGYNLLGALFTIGTRI